MTSRFEHHVDLSAALADVFHVLTDPDLLAARYEAAGAQDVHVIERRGDPDVASSGLTIVYRRVEADSLPGPVARLVRGGAQLTQTDEWQPAGADGARQARWTVVTKGVAVDIGGTMALLPHAGGSRLVESGRVTARVPMVGGAIERIAVEQSGAKLRREWAWLTDNLR